MPRLDKKVQKRQVAYKIGIKDILNSKYVKTEGLNPNYFELNRQEISRVSVVGVIVQKTEIDNYKNLTIDDGTGKLSARVFESNFLLNKVNVGDIVLIVGRPREFSSEKYLLIEVIRKIDAGWAKVRKLELEKSAINYNINPNKDSFEEEIIDEELKNKILKLIKDLDRGDGVSIENILSRDIKEIDKMVNILLEEGEIFENRPGKVKILE